MTSTSAVVQQLSLVGSQGWATLSIGDCFGGQLGDSGTSTMDLAFNAEAPFTRWIIATGALQEPFTVVDVGVQGGESVRWHLLSDHLIVHGFDPIVEVIETLRRQNAYRSNHTYHWLAIGNEDGEREFYVNAADPYSSSFFPQSPGRFRPDGAWIEQPRRVSVRRLDSLLADGTIPQADFLKVDVEGFEQDVFLGANELLRSTIGIETESNFGISPIYPKSHFVTLHDMLLQHRFLVFDLNFNRIPRAAFQLALQRRGLDPITDQESIGKPATLVVLLCRDFIAETDEPHHYAAPPSPPPATDALLKAMVIYELHGLSDIALDTAKRFNDQLGTRLDVEEAMTLLADVNCRPPSYSTLLARLAPLQAELAAARGQLDHRERQLQNMMNSMSWRVTEPLRSIRRRLPL
jgi:FkbM family methyltransferase